MASRAGLAAADPATTLSATLSLLGSGFVIVQTSRHGARSKRDWLIILSALTLSRRCDGVRAAFRGGRTAHGVRRAGGGIQFFGVASFVWTANLSLEVVDACATAGGRCRRRRRGAASSGRWCRRCSCRRRAARSSARSAAGATRRFGAGCRATTRSGSWRSIICRSSSRGRVGVLVRRRPVGHLAAAAARDAGRRAADARPVAARLRRGAPALRLPFVFVIFYARAAQPRLLRNRRGAAGGAEAYEEATGGISSASR